MALSDNELSSEIPVGITDLLGLRSLNLRRTYIELDILELFERGLQQFNGKIPTSTQIQSFDASKFAGNDLCGPPLSDNSSINAVKPDDAGNRKGSEGGLEVDWFWFYVSAALRFVVAFWSIAGPLLFKKSWRYAYFEMLDSFRTKAGRCFHR
ncbi:hypothetical protein F3Y22_tig00111503pilonHSYRG00040 [Hibiscus syriacus]|uniref:Uncharacterized protein n=1 Tax=Hibiscus syriacus TaxID=106335 RepID=A0A6A2XPL7_HIBSY|nr:hypothetical protein F3Y22_tig00111503pilonHSYRG00040 [Hibiscus syriacus]